MKIFYVGNGRTRINWGARATSTALHDLLATEHTIAETIDNVDLDREAMIVRKNDNVFYRLLDKIDKKRTNMRGQKWKPDYMTDDINKTVETMLRLRSRHKVLEDIYNKLQACDAVVVNAEGNFIFATPPRRGTLVYLAILKMAKDMGKKAYCLNGMVSDCPVSGRNEKVVKQTIEIFKRCDGVSVRDPYSNKVLREIAPDLKFSFNPDALFTWFTVINKDPSKISIVIDEKVPKLEKVEASTEFDFTKPYITISGSSLAAVTKDKATIGYINLVNKLKGLGIQMYIVPTCRADIFLYEVATTTQVPIVPANIAIKSGAAILANSRAFVSGRFHPSILSSLGGTPCVFMGSNSHKTRSVQDLLEYTDPKEYKAIPDEKDIDDMYNDVAKILEQGDELRNKILNTVESLSKRSRNLLEILK